jgi:hypothetical protein
VIRWLRRLVPPGGLLFVLVVAATQTTTPSAGAACSSPVTTSTSSTGGVQVTASTFGGPSDPGTGSTGYRGDNLYQHPDSFAELNMGTALGNLPYMAPITVTYKGRSMVLYKRDIGAGGPGLNGTTRAVDVWFQAAQQLGLPGLAVVTVQAGAVAGAACTASTGAVISGATDPAPGGTWSRLDMGFDGNYDMTKGAVAVFSGTLHCCVSGWPGQGQTFWIVNDNQTGPDYTRAVYYAEGATPTVPSGTHVTVGQRVGNPVALGGCAGSCANPAGNFELGPSQVASGDALAKVYGLGSPAARNMVLAFYAWLRQLGAGPATSTSNAGAP